MYLGNSVAALLLSVTTSAQEFSPVVDITHGPNMLPVNISVDTEGVTVESCGGCILDFEVEQLTGEYTALDPHLSQVDGVLETLDVVRFTLLPQSTGLTSLRFDGYVVQDRVVARVAFEVYLEFSTAGLSVLPWENFVCRTGRATCEIIDGEFFPVLAGMQ